MLSAFEQHARRVLSIYQDLEDPQQKTHRRFPSRSTSVTGVGERVQHPPRVRHRAQDCSSMTLASLVSNQCGSTASDYIRCRCCRACSVGHKSTRCTSTKRAEMLLLLMNFDLTSSTLTMSCGNTSVSSHSAVQT